MSGSNQPETRTFNVADNPTDPSATARIVRDIAGSVPRWVASFSSGAEDPAVDPLWRQFPELDDRHIADLRRRARDRDPKVVASVLADIRALTHNSWVSRAWRVPDWFPALREVVLSATDQLALQGVSRSEIQPTIDLIGSMIEGRQSPAEGGIPPQSEPSEEAKEDSAEWAELASFAEDVRKQLADRRNAMVHGG